MPFYMFQASYAPAAIKELVAHPQDRQKAAAKMVESLGGTLHSFFFSFGTEDIVAIIEVDDDKAMAAGSMLVGASGTFSGGSTTKLLTMAEAMEAMTMAGKAAASYSPVTG